MIGFDAAAFRRGFWRGALAGTVTGVVLALLMWPRPAVGSPSGDGQALAVATSSDGASITLHAGTGICLGQARAAVWRPGPGSSAASVPGCWLLLGDVVLVSFLDGERGDIPVRALARVGGI